MLSFLSPQYKYHLGYALSGGGAKGFAHLGALQLMEEKGLTPDIIAGTSAGSLAGVLYADGYHPQEIHELFEKSRDIRELIELALPTNGFFKTRGLQKFLKNNLRAQSFEQLQIPFIAVATDWKRGVTVQFSEGNLLAESVVASCTVPVLFQPQVIDGVEYVDGGLFKNFPVSVIREDCKYIIGVNVTPILKGGETNTIRSMSERTFHLMSNANSVIDRKLCDILIEVRGSQRFAIRKFDNIHSISDIGYNECLRVMNQARSQKIIKRCLRYVELKNKVKSVINQKVK